MSIELNTWAGLAVFAICLCIYHCFDAYLHYRKWYAQYDDDGDDDDGSEDPVPTEHEMQDGEAARKRAQPTSSEVN